MRYTRPAFTVAALIALGVAACGEQSGAVVSDTDAKLKKDINDYFDGVQLSPTLLADPMQAGEELSRRLREQVQLKNGFLLIRPKVPGTNFETFILPTDSPWVITCGFGVSIDLGASVKVSESVTDSAVKVTLVFGALMPSAFCDEIGPMLGSTLQKIAAGE